MPKIIDLSSPISSASGWVLGRIMYDGIIDCLLVEGEGNWMMNEGSRHILMLGLPVPDLQAFFDILEEHFQGHANWLRGLAMLKSKAGL